MGAALAEVPGRVVEVELDDDRPSASTVEVLGEGRVTTELLVSVDDGALLGTAADD